MLSVRDASKKILWSWHIWVTDENISSATNITLTNLKNSEYHLMTVPLGHCYPDRRTYTPREIGFQFKQEDSGMTAEVTFQQTTTSYLEYGRNITFYQYGRSTPERLMGTGMANSFKTLYGDEYPYVTKNSTVTRGIAIQSPCTHYWTENGEWLSPTKQKNLWDVKNTSTTPYDNATSPSIKTIYDPSPVGYKVAEPLAFNAFTLDGNNQTTSSKFNVLGSYNKGWTYYTKPNKQGNTYYMYAFNCIHYKGATFYYAFEQCNYIWTTCPVNSTEQGFTFATLNNNRINPSNETRRSYGVGVQPVSDDQ